MTDSWQGVTHHMIFHQDNPPLSMAGLQTQLVIKAHKVTQEMLSEKQMIPRLILKMDTWQEQELQFVLKHGKRQRK